MTSASHPNALLCTRSASWGKKVHWSLRVPKAAELVFLRWCGVSMQSQSVSTTSKTPTPSKTRERQPKGYDQTWSSNMSNRYKPLNASGCNIFTYLNATSTAADRHSLKSHPPIVLSPYVLLFCGCHVGGWRWIGCQGESFFSRIFEGHKGCWPQKASVTSSWRRWIGQFLSVNFLTFD